MGLRQLDDTDQLSKPLLPSFKRSANSLALRRFNFSLREVKELLAERGFEVSYETIRRWVARFGPQMAKRLRRLRGTLHPQWHPDKKYAPIGGRLLH